MQNIWSWLAAAVLYAGLCPPAAAADKLIVFAAASLQDALSAVARSYKEKSGVRIVQSYAGSGTLARQIDRGAPAAIFISANIDWMNYLEKRGLLRAGSRRDLLKNELVLIAPAGSTASLAIGPGFPLAAALGGGRLAMADPDFVPAGKYGRAALETLGVWTSVRRQIARGENVRTALNFVSRGEAPFGIVYRTDAEADRNVRIVGVFPADSYPPIVYPVALVVTGANASAQAFYLFLQSASAAAIFRRHGFVPY